MSGRPVWLASVSVRTAQGAIIPTGRWAASTRARAERTLEALLDGIGDVSREVLFRMNITLCRHRGLTDEEEAGLPGSFHDFRATDTAGCSVETIWRRGVDSPASLPCEDPGREPIGDRPDPDLWLPIPCGACEPCRARERAAAK